MVENIVRQTAREHLQTYHFDRYKDLAARLEQRRANQALLHSGSEVRSIAEESDKWRLWQLEPNELYAKEGSYRLLTGGGSITRCFDALELGYKLTLDWIVDENERGTAMVPDIHTFGTQTVKYMVFQGILYEQVEGIIETMYRRIDVDLLNHMQWLYNGRKEEVLVLIPAYFKQYSFLKDFSEKNAAGTIGELIRIGKITSKSLKRKIPRFPPEVEEQRLQTLEATRAVLDGFYETLLTYLSAFVEGLIDHAKTNEH